MPSLVSLIDITTFGIHVISHCLQFGLFDVIIVSCDTLCQLGDKIAKTSL